jgi:hypothetical protein
LIAHYAAGIVANGCGCVQANDGSAVLADQCDLPALNHGLALDLIFNALSFCPVDENFPDLPLQYFFLGIVAQHAHQSRIHVQNGAIRRGDIDAFLQ